MVDGPRCLYYALGGGLGHGMRSLALARRLAESVGGRHVLLVNTPFSETLARAAAGSTIEFRRLEPTATPAAAAPWVRRQVDEFQPELLVVDVFPRGVGGELADWLPSWQGGLRLLTSRSLPASYFDQFEVAEFVGLNYDLVLAPGEVSPFAEVVPVVATDAWMLRRREEISSPTAAAQKMGLAPHERCLLVVGSGTFDECHEWVEQFAALVGIWPAGAMPLRLALPLEVAAPGVAIEQIVRHAPLVEWLPAAAAVIGNAGFHLVHECRWLGIPAKFVARPRQYDDQSGRRTAREQIDEHWFTNATPLVEWTMRMAGALEMRSGTPDPTSDGLDAAVTAILGRLA